jgi:hypothetical protein
MPLREPQPSRATKKAFQDGLAEMIRLGRAPKDLPKEGFPLRTYVLGLQDIVKGKGVDRAKPILWDFLVAGDSGSAVLVAVADPPGKKLPKMTSLTREPAAAEEVQAAQQVEKLSPVRRHRYELRRLRISALSIHAFWLKSLEKGETDLAVPHHAIREKLKRMRPYPMEQFLSVVRPIAEKRLAAEAALRRKSKAAERR